VSKFSLGSLRLRLFVIVLLSALPLLGLTLYSDIQQRQIAREAAQQEALRLVRSAINEQARIINSSEQVLITLAQLPILLESDAAACQALFTNLLTHFSYSSGFTEATPGGDVICSAPPISAPVNFADRLWFQQLLQTKNFVVSDYQMGRISGKSVIVMAYPVLDTSNDLQAVVSIGLDLSWINRLNTEADLPPGSEYTVIDRGGIVLARFPEAEMWVGKPASASHLVNEVINRHAEGTIETTGLDGIQRLYAFGPLTDEPSSNAYVLIGIPITVAYAEVNHILATNLAGLGLVVLLVLTAAWFGGYIFILRRVNLLMQATKKLEAGDLSARTGLTHGSGELDQLGSAFDQMAETLQLHDAEIKRAEVARQEFEHRYQMLVEQIPAIVYIDAIDDASSTTYMNPQVKAATGYSAEEWMADPDLWKKLLHPEDRAAIIEKHLHTNKTGESFVADYRLISREGREVWIHDEALLIRDEYNQPRFWQGVMIDITERRQAADRLRTEIDRTKVLLQASKALNAKLDIGAISMEVCKEAAHALSISDAVIYLYDEGHQELRFGNGYGPVANDPRLVPIPRTVFDKLLPQTGQAVIFSDARSIRELPFGEILAEHDVRSIASVIMLRENHLMGVLAVCSPGEERSFNQDELALLQGLANQATQAIINARLFEETNERAAQLALLYDAGLALNSQLEPRAQLEFLFKIAMDTIGAQRATFFRLDDLHHQLIPEYVMGFSQETSQKVQELRVETGDENHPIGWVEKQRVPLNIADTHADKRCERIIGDVRSGLWVPVMQKGRFLGVLGLVSTREEAFSPHDERLLMLFANQTAVAMENARLYQESQRRLRRLEILRDIDLTITGSFDLSFNLNTILKRVVAELEVDAADVLLLDPHTQILECASRYGFRTGALRYTSLPVGEGYAGQAVLETRIVHIPDLTEEMGAFNRATLLPQEGYITYYAVPLITKGQVKGVMEIFSRKLFTPDQEWLDFLETLSGQSAIAIDNSQLFIELQNSNIILNRAYDTTLEGWSRALDMRDHETEGHSSRVTEITLKLARAMGIDDEKLVFIRRGAILHDIGKMVIPDHILLKPGPLTKEEWAIMREHPTFAVDLISPIEYLRPALDIPQYHHERWDGSGYPQGLKGDQIPLAARIFAIADVMDALCSDRPYREAWPRKKALAYIRKQSGKHFDPQVVEVFFQMLEENGVMGKN
jgi:PAS domain S-box-containing protein/putative nucleotidyltransferase with HDIG domain